MNANTIVLVTLALGALTQAAPLSRDLRAAEQTTNSKAHARSEAADTPTMRQPSVTPTGAVLRVPAQREADYQTVVKAAEGFEGNFVMRPSSEAEVRRTLAAMVSRGATVDDIQKYYYRLCGSKYASIVSSGMVAHARTPFEHAVCRTLYASDLWYTMRTESGTPPDVLMEMEEALEEARREGIHTNVAYTAYLVHTLGANVYAGEEHDFDKSWALYLQYEELLANKSFVRNGYFQSLAAEITRGKVPHKISDETLRDMRERVEALAVDPKTDEVGRSHCSNLLKALEKREQGGATRTIN